jgi:hypothetical protein
LITVMLKRPHQEAEVVTITDTSELNDLVEGDFEVVSDDRLSGFHLVVNEEARGVQANNFPITANGFLDWVYGPCVFVKADGTSLTDDDISAIRQYLSSKS